jgi:hypothetical protein
MLELTELQTAIDGGDAEKLADMVVKFDLKLDGNRITAEKEVTKRYEDFWDRRQLIRKILLNSSY